MEEAPKPVNRKYRAVSGMNADEHIRTVREIFATITDRYDFLNHFLSLRRDVAWRRSAARRMHFPRTRRLLDVATGTGDLAIEAIRQHPEIRVTGIDIVPEMMVIGRRKIEKSLMSRRILFMQGDALHLPFADGAFDVSVIAFGIRNIPDRIRALREMMRVVVPGGQVIVLEMHFPKNLMFQRLYDLYLNRILPVMAGAFSGSPAAYRYLADSIMHFPSPGRFAALMEEAGLETVTRYPLTLGVTCLYLGTKPKGVHPDK
ncbi:MAG: Demethylmenaquinone methyltransferase [Syntrophaceae bacterium PtaB.Bin095]|jgi:demethylmenaquinone methyltransferase/2-methoxy-6-polyprenyl-1,4-benzoquinol methylase|nr:MAG: Demethylmenaquinone methyltransferase [Syntrophaceae bacterium PtaB.Bin095]